MHQLTNFVCTLHFHKFVQRFHKLPVRCLPIHGILPRCKNPVIPCHSVNSRSLLDVSYLKSVYVQSVGHLFPLGQEKRHVINVVIGYHLVQLLVCHCILQCQGRHGFPSFVSRTLLKERIAQPAEGPLCLSCSQCHTHRCPSLPPLLPHALMWTVVICALSNLTAAIVSELLTLPQIELHYSARACNRALAKASQRSTVPPY